jgi:transcriptional regulator with XRE-family HTH domain
VQECEVLRAERERRNLTQAQLSKSSYMHEATLRCYELGVRDIPANSAARMAKVLRSPRFAMTHCHQCSANLFIPPYLDQVDHHPLAALDAVLSEAKEAAAAVESLRLRNKTSPADLTPDERRQVERAADQLLDLIPAVAMAVSSWAETFGIDCWALVERNHGKLVARGYTQGEEVDAA